MFLPVFMPNVVANEQPQNYGGKAFRFYEAKLWSVGRVYGKEIMYLCSLNPLLHRYIF